MNNPELLSQFLHPYWSPDSFLTSYPYIIPIITQLCSSLHCKFSKHSTVTALLISMVVLDVKFWKGRQKWKGLHLIYFVEGCINT